jgi:phospholipid-binding lipoprotein MlaA
VKAGNIVIPFNELIGGNRCKETTKNNQMWLVCVVFFMSGCATTIEGKNSNDPLEPLNRKIYAFNMILDENLFKPVADTYVKFTPDPLQIGIANFFENLGEINIVINDFLQGKFKQGLMDSGRFVINSTFGVIGLVDHATDLGLRKHEEDFGQTLAVWGVGQGPYLMLPVLGPQTLRDTPAIGMSIVANPLFYVDDTTITISLSVLGAIDLRARSEGAIQFVNEAAVDPYAFTREAYLQRREFLIYDGNPPTSDLLDLLEDLEDEDTGKETQ